MARQVIQLGQWRSCGTRNYYSRCIGNQWRRVIDLRSLCLARGNQSGSEVAVSFGQLGDHLFACNRNEHRNDRQIAGLELFVQLFFQLTPQFVHRTLHLAAIEIKTQRGRHDQNSQNPPLGDDVQVAAPSLAIDPSLDLCGSYGSTLLRIKRGRRETDQKGYRDEFQSHRIPRWAGPRLEYMR